MDFLLAHTKALLFLSLFMLIGTRTCAQHAAESKKQATALTEAAMQQRRSGNIAEAIRLCEEEIALRQNHKHPFSLIANAVHNLAVNYSLLPDYDKAIQTELKALEIFKKSNTPKQSIPVCLCNLSTYYYARGRIGDLGIAIQYAEQALAAGSKNTPTYVNTANMLIAYYAQSGQSERADQLSKNILKMGRKVFGEESTQYANILANQTLHLTQAGNSQQALSYGQQGISIYENAGDTLNILFAKLLMTTASLHATREEYRQTILLLERAKPIFLQLEGTTGINYTHCVGDLSAAYSKMGDLEKSNDLAISISRAKDDTSLQNAAALTHQAQIYAANGDYRHAIPTLQRAIHIYALNHDSIGMASTYITQSGYYNRHQQTDKAIETCQLAIDILSPQANHPEMLARAYNNMAIFSRSQGNTPAALDYSRKAIQHYETAADTLNTQYATILGNLSIFHADQGETAEAINYSLRSYNIHCQLLGPDHPDNVLTLQNLANFYYQQGDIPRCYHYCHQALQLQSQIVRNNFTHMTTNGREAYWNTKKYIYTQTPIFAYNAHPADTLILNDTYNAQLFTKGILLNSEIDFKTLLLRSGNQQLLDQYNQLTALNETIEHLLGEATPETAQQADSLRKQAVILERELIRNSKEYGDYTANMNITAATIAQHLGENDVAIELFEAPTADGGTSYFAMYLRKGWQAPRLVHLFGTAQLQAFNQNGNDFFQLIRQKDGINYIFNNPQLGQLVWHPLELAWQGDTLQQPVQNIYFSPTGLFYKWGIEYLQMDNEHRICDLYTLHRLSSTKQLAHRTHEAPITSATIFGGINYDLTVAEMQDLHNNNKIDYKATYMTYDVDLDRNTQQELSDTRDTGDLDLTMDVGDPDNPQDVRAGISFLQGTYDEAMLIGEQLMQHNIPTNMVLSHEATEENFKALSGSGQSLVHIATHGFSFPEGSNSRRALAYLFGKKVGTPAYNNSMNYSGLLLAGAANIFNLHQRIPTDIEDGVLTAAEISALDLRGLDLVVLSACQTALGDVKDDGVFGLQRGFKKAGAHTLLMSLWSVNDKATQAMMTSFYTALVQGDDRHTAFRKAQQHLRNAGYTDPYYWASFIMLDDM